MRAVGCFEKNTTDQKYKIFGSYLYKAERGLFRPTLGLYSLGSPAMLTSVGEAVFGSFIDGKDKILENKILTYTCLLALLQITEAYISLTSILLKACLNNTFLT